jgi:hypothetical protein
LSQQTDQFALAVLESPPIGAVHDPHEAIRLLKVVPPVRPNGLLATDVPDVQLKPDGKSHSRP